MANSDTDRMRKARSQKADLRAAIENMGFEIGDNGCPLPKDPERRLYMATHFDEALSYYFPQTFYKEHTHGQRSDIHLMQHTMYDGGQFAFAAPRGDGKSSRAEACAILALLYGLHPFVLFVGADQGLANEGVESIKLELRSNDLLLDDFPEVCVAAFICDDKAQRARAMNYGGEDCQFRWGAQMLVLPTIPGSVSAGGVLVPRGITGRIRGMKRKHPDGRTVRPSLFLIDDFQTDESANSPGQCRTREKLIAKAILGAAGHGQKPTALAPVTIIAPNDAASAILDREAHPEWHGRTRGMISKWPDAQETLWKEYHKIRKDCQRNEEDPVLAVEFYRANREAMDEGAVVDWILDPGRDELSALHYAEDLLCDRGKEAFSSEYQNMPISDIAGVGKHDAEFIKTRLNGLKPLMVPEDCRWITCGADINKSGIHWAATGISDTLAAYIAAYGKYPVKGNLWEDLDSSDDTKNNLHRQQQIYDGIFQLCRILQDFTFAGPVKSLTSIGFDCNYETHTVLRACQAANRVFPFTVFASGGYADEKYRPTKSIGRAMDKCHLAEFPSVPESRVVVYSSGEWHKRAFDAWKMEAGAPGSVSMFNPPDGMTHNYLADHVAADILVDVLSGASGMVYRFKSFGRQNDLNDAITQAIVMGAMYGASPSAEIEKREAANQASVQRRGVLRQHVQL